MDKIFDDIQDVPLSDEYIKKIVPDVPVMLYDELKRINNIDSILLSGACIILYQIKHNIGHWICILKHGDMYEYFDPYGHKVDYYINKCLNKTPYLSRLLFGTRKKVISNNYKYQESKKDIATCGRHVVCRCLLKTINLKQYYNIFKNTSKIQSDDLVTFITEIIQRT
jgi:hypothetical protein